MGKYDMLNPMQREAVEYTEGPLLILAGAGSGKTRVLTHRAAWLIEEKKVEPWHILAITFTNKAAGEMRERIDRIVGEGADRIWVSTFHSMCVRILRRFIDQIGFETGFSIYDTDDQKTLMKQILKDLAVDTRQLKEKQILSQISAAKNAMIDEDAYQAEHETDYPEKIIARCYMEYQRRLRKNNALDFDDLLLKTVQLFEEAPEVLHMYQERFRYIMVDEYQDTNMVQFRLVKLLSEKYKNLCVVGDDDQSIYRFRGADIRNILSFEEVFPGAKVIRLEQNYRSTKNILDTANGVIRNNRGRKEKTLWTAGEEGDLVHFTRYESASDEADAIADDIGERVRKGEAKYADFAVLYRTNAQSRLLEEKFLRENIPYRLVGGVNFYQRKEIKDILAYLKTVANGRDEVAVQRVINVPKRGIGAATIAKVSVFATANGLTFYQALQEAREIPTIGRASGKIAGFTGVIEDLRELAEGSDVKTLIKAILSDTGYEDELLEEGKIEAEARMENIEELVNKAVSYWESAEEPSLDGFLADVALVADIDSMDDSENRVVLMTLHASKGLEFPVVYMSGMEEGLFPGIGSINSGDTADMEEERRLCYVGITRAMRELHMSAARRRMIRGETVTQRESRFVEEVPPKLLIREDHTFGGDSFFDDDDDDMPWSTGFGSTGGRSSSGRGFGGREDTWQPSGSRYSVPVGRPGNPFGGASGSGRGAGTQGAAGKPSKKEPSAPAFGLAFKVEKAPLTYGVGDRVRHMRFGEGTVSAIADGGRDYEVTVLFDNTGVKKMYASFAKLEKV